MLDKVYDDGIEKAVLASVITYPEVLQEHFDKLRPTYFFDTTHLTIYKTIYDLKQKGLKTDHLTIMSELKKLNDNIKFNSILSKLNSDIATSYRPNLERNINILKDLHTTRSILHYCDEVKAKITDGERIDAVMDAMQSGVVRITKSDDSSIMSMREIGYQALKRIDAVSKVKNGITGIPTNFNHFDNLTGGIQSSELWVLGARPGMGKTALALQMAINMAEKGYKPLFFSLEMSARSLYFRQLSVMTSIDLLEIIKARIKPEEMEKILAADARLGELPLLIDDSSDGTVGRIMSEARKAKLKGQCDIVFIDHINLMASGTREQNRNLEMKYVTEKLKALAKELDMPVIALCQLSRKCEERQNKRPVLSDLRESGDIEQNADVIMFIYRDAYYNKETDKPNIAELHFAKFRNGPNKTIELSFLDSIVKFSNLETIGGF